MIAQVNVMNQVGISLSAVVGLIFTPTDIVTTFVVVSMAGMLTFAWQRVNEGFDRRRSSRSRYHFAD
jgi:hypothetical protein